MDSHNYSPMLYAENEVLEEFMTYLPFIINLENELSKPLRRDDNELDYLPTQYIAEFIKSLGFDGLRYKSSLSSTGHNLAIFNPNKLRCIEVVVLEVEEIKFKHKPTCS